MRRRAEDHAREVGAAAVTAEHLHTLARRRFGDKGPPVAAHGTAPSADPGGEDEA